MTSRTLIVALSAVIVSGAGPYDARLSNERQITHALNRLTFGQRAGDVEEIRRSGVAKWIDLQLHPERIVENPVVESRLKALDTLRMDVAALVKDYPAVSPALAPRFTPINELLTPDQVRIVFNGSLEDRRKVLDSFDAVKRRKILATVAPQSFSGMPDLQKEAEAARKAQQEETQKEYRRVMPPLADLLNADQMEAAMRGNAEQLADLFAFLDPVKRQQLAAALPPKALAAFPEMRRAGLRLRQPQQVVLGDLREAKVFRAIYSNRQLEEVLVDFWFNHFNVFEGKANDRVLLTSYERDAIRPHVLGHFKDLLLATARHPAMLYYLDNWQSISPNAFEIGPFAPPVENMARQLARQAHGINENYGRELMELHTLGVKGGYTQQDVIEVARCFTGWTIRTPATNPEYVFAGFMHDYGEKTVLGHKIAAGGGEQDGLQVIDILSHAPATAQFISKKLAQRFVADEPPQPLIDRMAQTFTRTDGDLRAVLAAMFASPEFLSEGAWQSKVKSPFEMVVSAVRAMHGDVTDTFALVQKIGDLGEPLYAKAEPTGYSNSSETWLSTGGLLSRMNYALALASGQIAGVKIDSAAFDGKDTKAMTHLLLGGDASPQTQEALDGGLQGKEPTPRQLASLLIGSPDFQKR